MIDYEINEVDLGKQDFSRWGRVGDERETKTLCTNVNSMHLFSCHGNILRFITALLAQHT